MTPVEKNLYLESQNSRGKDLVVKCQQICQEFYPRLSIRWSRIYGRRWAYICGGSMEPSHDSLQFKLNRDYGICIDNPDEINTEELDRLLKLLRKVFSHEIL